MANLEAEDPIFLDPIWDYLMLGVTPTDMELVQKLQKQAATLDKIRASSNSIRWNASKIKSVTK